jgi:hypothetical protein
MGLKRALSTQYLCLWSGENYSDEKKEKMCCLPVSLCLRPPNLVLLLRPVFPMFLWNHFLERVADGTKYPDTLMYGELVKF